MFVILFFGGQRSWTLGLLPRCFSYEVTGGGLESETCPHIFVIETVSTDMLRGSPASSSNSTRRLSVGLRKNLGMWYLKICRFLAILGNKHEFTAVILVSYHICEGEPLGWRKEIQYLPILSPLIQASPFPIEPRFRATGSVPSGASNFDWWHTSTVTILYRKKCVGTGIETPLSIA